MIAHGLGQGFGDRAHTAGEMNNAAPGQIQGGRAVQCVGLAARGLRGDQQLRVDEEAQGLGQSAQMCGNGPYQIGEE